jgi:PAS domain S-box-containing protein
VTAPSGETILVVEDNPITRKMLRVALEIEGYTVLPASDGKTALELSGPQRPDLMIVDFVLPDTDGLQLLAEVRRRLGAPELPSILVTGMVSRLEELRERAGGITQIVAKPVEPSQLLEIIRGQLAPTDRPGSHRILVVDDEPLNIKLTAFRLKQAGYEVETASSGKEALETAHLRPPDAILSDVMMPAMDGFTFCREARRDPTLAAIPIILTSSAYVDDADRELARQMGASTLVVRSPDLHDTMNALEAGLGGASGPPPPATDDDVTALHQERLLVQLERQTARNEALVRQAAIQATALSIIRGLSEILAQPRDVPQILGDVLVHCLDAAGLSTGLLYVAGPGPGREPRLQAQFGIPADSHPDAEAVFGHPEILRRVVAAGAPVALSAEEDADVKDFLSRLGHSSALVVPFVVLGESFGELLLASDSHDLSEPSWIGFARNLALQFGQTVALGQSLKRLAASESRYRALMEHANDAIFVLNPHGTILEANRRSEGLLGLPRERVIDRHISEFAPVAPGETPEYVARFGQVLSAGGGRVDNVALRRADGALVQVDFSMSLNEIDGIPTVLSIGRDVTDRNRAEEDIHQRMQLATFEADVGTALVGQDPQPVALKRCAEAMVRHLNAAFARIWTLDEAGETLQLEASAGMYTHLDGGHARVPVGQFKIGLIAAEREPHLTNDVLHDPRVSDPAWANREGMVAFAGYPLIVGDQLVGVMAMFARHTLSQTVLDAMASVANQIALGIERNRTEKLLNEAQHRLQHVVSSSPAVLYSLTIEGETLVPTWVSANIEHLTGYTPEEVSGPDWWAERVHPDDRDGVMAQVPPLLSQGAATREFRFRHKDGTYGWVRDEQILITDAAGRKEVIGSWSDVSARKDAELRLRESEEQYRLLFDSNPFPMAVADRESLAFLAVNDASVRNYGFSRDEFLSMTISDLRTPEEKAAVALDYALPGRGDGAPEGIPEPRKHRKKDGTVIEVEIDRSAILFRGRPAWLMLAADVTQKKTLEAQLVKAQKMEAVGQLAGGVAHDFNNLLGVVTGYSELLIRELAPDSRERKRAEEIKRASDRAAALTRQLLAFGRRQVLQPKVLDLNEVVADVEKMLRRLITENIQIVTVAAPSLGRVRADAGQIEQVLMNLAINARDAMPAGGRLTIETGNIELDDTYVRTHPAARRGRYVMLAVSDTGHGMDAKTMSRIFEPFFTTKEEGKGTGLGLATVYGIVHQSGGTVNVYSEPGHGTAFKVYLPRVEADLAMDTPAEFVAPPGGTETILLVEDAEALRQLIRELLENAGYTVLDAEAPDNALLLVQSTPSPIHLILTDMVMPRMSGRDLARQILTLKPDAHVVFMSGYTDQVVGDDGTLEPGALFLQKPFTMDSLLKTIRRALDAETKSRSGSGA